MASSSPSSTTITAQISITRRFSHRPAATTGKDSFAFSQLKKVSWTRGQPGAEVRPPITTASSTTVLSAAVMPDRIVLPRR
jgi:hypothetical protein